MRTSSLQQGPNRGGRWAWPVAILAAAAILCTYLFFAGRTTLWGRDEPRFARATVEMLESGNYLYPTFNGRLRPDKPILVYWLMSTSVRLLGPTEPALRLFSAVGAAATCLLTWWIGRRLFGTGAGLWAMLVLASTPLLLVLGTLATADGVMLPFVVGALACFVASACGGARAIHLVGLAVATGLAMLAKGPMGLVPLIVIATAVAVGRRPLPVGLRYLLVCVVATLAGAAIFCAWALPANQATGGRLLRLAIGHHVLTRMSRPLEHHGGNYFAYLPYYVPVVLIGFFPWVLHLPGAISAGLGGRLGGPRGRAILVAMILPVFVLMTFFVATKLPHYILPIWPGLALAVGATIQAWRAGALAERDLRWLRRGAWLFGIGGGVVGVAILVGSWLVPLPALRVGGMAVGALLVAVTAAGVWAHRARGPAASGVVLLAGTFLEAVALNVLVAPAVEELKIVPGLARRINAATPPNTPVATYGFDEPNVNFYVGRPIRSFSHEGATPQQVLTWLRQPRDGVLVLTDRALRSLVARGAVPANVLASASGLNDTRMTRLHLVALRRRAATATTAPE